MHGDVPYPPVSLHREDPLIGLLRLQTLQGLLIEKLHRYPSGDVAFGGICTTFCVACFGIATGRVAPGRDSGKGWAQPPFPGIFFQAHETTRTPLAAWLTAARAASPAADHYWAAASAMPKASFPYGPCRPGGRCHANCGRSFRRDAAIVLFRYLVQDTGGNCSTTGITATECFGASGQV